MRTVAEDRMKQMAFGQNPMEVHLVVLDIVTLPQFLK